MTGQSRTCRPCFACCQGWLSGDILGNRVSAGNPCPHGSEHGCAVYADRPKIPCKSFICSWLIVDSPLPDWMRPDLSGAIVLLSMDWEGEKVISAIPAGDAIPEKTLEWLKAYAVRVSRPLIFYQRTRHANGRYKGMKRIGFGPPEFRQKVARMKDSGETASIPMKSV